MPLDPRNNTKMSIRFFFCPHCQHVWHEPTTVNKSRSAAHSTPTARRNNVTTLEPLAAAFPAHGHALNRPIVSASRLCQHA
jgi:hypothetical protein